MIRGYHRRFAALSYKRPDVIKHSFAFRKPNACVSNMFQHTSYSFCQQSRKRNQRDLGCCLDPFNLWLIRVLRMKEYFHTILLTRQTALSNDLFCFQSYLQ